MTRLKDEIIEDTSKLGEIIELCEDEIKQFSKYEDHIEECDNSVLRGVLKGRKELADAVLKILGLLPE